MQEGMNATEISKQLDDVDKDSAPSYLTVVKWLPKYNGPERAFEEMQPEWADHQPSIPMRTLKS